ncbi:Ankyrin-3 (ANK-3) (Ankyrin-G) [Durusdinium trenchii]|uniref:Ankyrin-3 (ANK-3) (Ankyrin-G) n=1 Tax=Durusdinium trenchii TaxID=1381693 RepID=A0ABP0RWJ6_9DINO
MFRVLWAISGRSVAAFAPEQVEGKSVRWLKRMLAKQIGFTRFQQRCFAEDLGRLLDDQVQLLVVDFEQSHECDVKLLMACATYRYEEVEMMLQKPLASDFTRDFGWTALHTAAWAGSSKCISLLLEAQADLDRQDWFGSTPLYLAAERNQLEAVWLLVAAGADESKAANDGSRPLDIAIASEHLSVALLLLLWEHLPLVTVACSHGRKADVEHVLKDCPSKSCTRAGSPTGWFGTHPSQWLSV